MGIVDYIDIFGVTPYFYIKSREKFKSVFGASLTITCVLVLVTFIYFFGYDFFYKLNPKVIESTVYNQNYYLINLTSSQGIIAWKVEDDNGRQPDFSQVLFPRIVYEEFTMDNNSKVLNLIKSEILPQKRCSQVKEIDPNLASSQNMDHWWCLDFSDTKFQLGGYYGGNIRNTIHIYIDSCNADKSICSSKEEINKLAPGLNNNLYFSMLYPEAYFTPNNISNPLNYMYSYYSETIDLNVIKRNMFFFRNVTCLDDVGWISQSITSHTIFAYESIQKDFLFKSDSEWDNITHRQDTIIYMTSLYFNKNDLLCKRLFMKIQDLAAVVGGLINTVMLLSSFVGNYYNSLGIRVYLSNSFFTVGEQEKTGTLFNTEINLQKSTQKILESSLPHIKKDIRKNTSMVMLEPRPIKEKIIEYINPLKREEPKLSEIVKKEDAQIVKKSEPFSSVGLFCSFLCCNGKKYRELREAESIISKIFSFEDHMKNKFNFLKFKNVFFDKNQLVLFDNLEKLDVNDKENIKIMTYELNDCKSLESVMREFRRKKETNGLTELDIKLLKNSGVLNLFK